ncbi:unnamed protein product [Phytophthora lilii]|uniref:Unnamed protein product n=1 Tax=Phytophthora lilii TaxID=2077276 RepID=A0A9W6XY48_9STRA|nr:unnamed protein product [Phytophthora lilii]
MPTDGERSVWIQLVDRVGNKLSLECITGISVDARVARLKIAMKSTENRYLKGVDAKVFANAAAYTCREKELAVLGHHGCSDDDPLYAEVPKFWFKLVTVSHGIIGSWVVVTSLKDVDTFREAVKTKCSRNLADCEAFDLKVYANYGSYRDLGQAPLDDGAAIDAFGKTSTDPIFVVVPEKMPSVKALKQTRVREGANVDESESPAKKQKQHWKWKEEKEPTYSLEDYGLFFVNRDEAVKQLLSSHEINYKRATNYGAGLEWELPLVDNIFGLGKTTFGLNYVWKCKEQNSLATNKTTSHLNVLKKCQNRRSHL